MCGAATVICSEIGDFVGGFVGEEEVLDGGEVMVPDGVVVVDLPPVAAATVTASFIPPLEDGGGEVVVVV